MREDRIEVDEEEVFGGEYGESITLTISEVDEEGNQIFKIIPADTVYIKFNREEGSITLCSTADLDEDEEEVVAEIRMPANVFERFISDIENFIRNRRTKQARLDEFTD